MYRRIDFKRRKDGVPAKVAGIEYDPNRSAYIALLHYVDGEKRYILAPARLDRRCDGRIGPDAEIAVGNCMTSPDAPRYRRAQHRAAARPRWPDRPLGRRLAQLMAKDGDMATLRLPSGEMRMVRAECRATVGVIGNAEHQNVKIGKAGRKRHMGVRPQTRGVAMNPVDHPHGGGEGSTTAGRHPVTPWGVPTLGYRTRKKQQGVRPLHRARASPWEGQAMSRSSKKGPLVEERLMARDRSDERRGTSRCCGPGRARPRSSRRWSVTRSPSTTGETRSGVCQRVDGRTQARRVRADATYRGHAGSGKVR